jgi:hypothetical protein
VTEGSGLKTLEGLLIERKAPETALRVKRLPVRAVFGTIIDAPAFPVAYIMHNGKTSLGWRWRGDQHDVLGIFPTHGSSGPTRFDTGGAMTARGLGD